MLHFPKCYHLYHVAIIQVVDVRGYIVLEMVIHMDGMIGPESGSIHVESCLTMQ